jgi:hypothetical protein
MKCLSIADIPAVNGLLSPEKTRVSVAFNRYEKVKPSLCFTN